MFEKLWAGSVGPRRHRRHVTRATESRPVRQCSLERRLDLPFITVVPADKYLTSDSKYLPDRDRRRRGFHLGFCHNERQGLGHRAVSLLGCGCLPVTQVRPLDALALAVCCTLSLDGR